MGDSSAIACSAVQPLLRTCSWTHGCVWTCRASLLGRTCRRSAEEDERVWHCNRSALSDSSAIACSAVQPFAAHPWVPCATAKSHAMAYSGPCGGRIFVGDVE